ncbi:MAG TPA: tripartite tricarboxylate transporter substrate binding protein [Xanthobacteraceae bacterium]|nr:tripartite tricarboxylate transporter substrate binding protein [Xanthobacteraceae bacterium]
MTSTRTDKAATTIGSAAIIATVLSASLVALEPTSAAAQKAWKPDRPIEIVVGTDPGSGFDRTARLLQKIWQGAHLVDEPVTVVNKAGGFGAVGWTYMNQRGRAGNVVAIMSPLLLTNRIAGNMDLSYGDVTPLALLEDEEIAFAVYTDSTIKTGGDFIARLRHDPSSVSVGVSGIGGQNHVALALVAGAAGGIDLTKLKVVSFAGSGDVVTSVIGGHVESTASPASTIAPQVAAGRLRAIGISSEKRIGGVLADVPTWREQGVDAVFSNWRGVIGPKGMPAEEVQYWDGVFAKTVATPEWQQEVERSQVTSHYLPSRDAAAFLATENAKLSGVMGTLGLNKQVSAR